MSSEILGKASFILAKSGNITKDQAKVAEARLAVPRNQVRCPSGTELFSRARPWGPAQGALKNLVHPVLLDFANVDFQDLCLAKGAPHSSTSIQGCFWCRLGLGSGLFGGLLWHRPWLRPGRSPWAGMGPRRQGLHQSCAGPGLRGLFVCSGLAPFSAASVGAAALAPASPGVWLS